MDIFVLKRSATSKIPALRLFEAKIGGFPTKTFYVKSFVAAAAPQKTSVLLHSDLAKVLSTIKITFPPSRNVTKRCGKVVAAAANPKSRNADRRRRGAAAAAIYRGAPPRFPFAFRIALPCLGPVNLASGIRRASWHAMSICQASACAGAFSEAWVGSSTCVQLSIKVEFGHPRIASELFSLEMETALLLTPLLLGVHM